MITVLLVDDDPAVRRGLRMRLEAEPDLRVIGEAGNADAALCLAGWARPQVVLLDVSLLGEDGLRIVPPLRAIQPPCAIVVLTLHDDAATRARAAAAGADAFLIKHGAVDEVLSMIRRVASTRN